MFACDLMPFGYKLFSSIKSVFDFLSVREVMHQLESKVGEINVDINWLQFSIVHT